MDSDTNDIVTQGLGNCITRDGQGQPTANLPMATFRHTGVANGVARTDYAAMGQLEDGTTNWAAAGGGNDALAATYIPALTTLVDGQLCYVRAVGANATTTPTFAPNGLTARTITKVGGAPLAAADINGSGHEIILRYNLANTRWELLNPALPIAYSNDAAAGVGPSFDIFRDSASPAVSDFIGSVDFNGRDSGAAKQLYARVVAQITDPVAATEDANLLLQAVIAGTLTTVLQNIGATILVPGAISISTTSAALNLTGSTTVNRPGSPTAGDTRYNTSLNGLEYWNGTAWIVLGQAPTITKLITGGPLTYTAPTGMVRARVRIWGPGGGGSGASANNGVAGSADTSWQVNASGTAWTAVKGSGGVQAGPGGAGGTGGTNGSTGTLVTRQDGGNGNSGGAVTSTPGGAGGSTVWGGAGPGAVGAGITAKANSGAGGGGGGSGATQGPGGGAGEYVEFWVTGMTSATYTIGLGGAGGAAGGAAGGNGAAGGALIEEFYS